MTQQAMILRHLQEVGHITPMDAVYDYSCTRLGGQIHFLRKKGYDISTEMVYGRNRFGGRTRYARYRLNGTAS